MDFCSRMKSYWNCPYPVEVARAACVVAKLIAKEGKSATLKLPSGEVRLIPKSCSATVGQVGNVGVNQKNFTVAKLAGLIVKTNVEKDDVLLHQDPTSISLVVLHLSKNFAVAKVEGLIVKTNVEKDDVTIH
ncbi:hypothetical protein F8388_005757 [Cannabis sativa]|uniref:Large ribosomal subunit protein uL2 C-terminal domain-containing protein n=1 Tax=Cannabis sativa TaxID=3483 RepID=A0A7J6HMI0_CANSA|nr:hypothetical protein F8388_005757 [Cannabis sativa]